MNVFQGEGGVVDELFFVKGNCFCKKGGCKSRQETVYHMCKTWLKKVHGGWDTGGVTFK